MLTAPSWIGARTPEPELPATLSALFRPRPGDPGRWRCRPLRPVPPVPAGAPQTKPRKEPDGSHHARPPGGRRPFRPPDAPLEPEDAQVHLRRARRHLHHLFAEDGRVAGR